MARCGNSRRASSGRNGQRGAGVKKEPEGNQEEWEKLGPYQLREQVPQDDHHQGELYRATHETSGTTALVFKPPEGDGASPLRDWRVRCISSVSPRYMALEVEDSHWAVAPDKYSVEALMCLFEQVREQVVRMAAAFPSYDEPRPWRRLGLAAWWHWATRSLTPISRPMTPIAAGPTSSPGA